MSSHKTESAGEHLGGKKKKKSAHHGHKVHHVHVRRADSGGYIVENHFKPSTLGAAPEPEEHVYPDMAGVQGHVADALPEEGGGAQDEGQAEGTPGASEEPGEAQ